MRNIYLLAAVVAVAVLIIVSCSKDGGGGGASVDCSTVTNKAFAADVNPIIQSTCTQPTCHGNGSGNGPGALTSYSQVFNARSSIRAVIISGQMPQMLTLPASQKNSIICWIDSGAPNN